MNVTKVSDLTYTDLAEYLHLTETNRTDQQTLTTLLGVATAYMKQYTGLSDLDAHEEFVICALILVQDMWDNRALYVDKTNLNHTVESILDLYSVNLLPVEVST